MFVATEFASVTAQVPNPPAALKPPAPASSLLPRPALPSTSPTASTSSALAPPTISALKTRPAAIDIKTLAVKPNEFPPIGTDQYKVAFECTIRGVPHQTDFSVYPRYRCDLDKPRTGELNKLTILRVDQFPSIDGITTKIVVIAKKTALGQPSPTQFHAAFQLYRDKSADSGAAMFKDFILADALL